MVLHVVLCLFSLIQQLTSIQDSTAALTRDPEIAVQPLGEVPPEQVRAVAAHLESTFAVRVAVLPSEALPASAWYAPRSRYRGERILERLEQATPARFTKVIGVMARDLSVTKGHTQDWGVLGVAGLRRRAGVVSTHRLGRSHASSRTVTRRLERVAAHELGHTFGVSHCPERRCIMSDARGTIASVDGSSGTFCARCRSRLGRALRDPEAHAVAFDVAAEPRSR